MTGAVHLRLVLDALRYLSQKENALVNLYLAACENAWFGGDFSKPRNQWRMYQIIGGESKNTDYYHDLAMYSNKLGKEDVSEQDGVIMTAINHYVSAHKPPTKWKYRDGYNYFYSSRTGNNCKAMVGKVNDLDVEVDNDYSPIVDRCRQYWQGPANQYGDNWECEIRNTVFIPASTIARFYYEKMLFNHANFIDVDGEVHDKIVGFMLLGPVMHAIGDCCTPHHFMSELGNFHVQWEDTVDTWATAGLLLDYTLADNLYKNHFAPSRIVHTSTGNLKGLLNIEYVVAELCARHGYEKLREMNPGKDVTSPGFWNAYFTGSNLDKVASDAKYLYNLAVAASARVLLQAFFDAGKVADPSFDYSNMVKSTPFFSQTNLALKKDWEAFKAVPEIKTWMDKIRPKGIGFLKQITGYASVPNGLGLGSPSLSDIPYAKSSVLLQFEPKDWRTSTSVVNQVRSNMLRWNQKELSDDAMINNLNLLEETLKKEFKKAYREMGITKAQPLKRFEFPEQQHRLRSAFGLPAVSNYQELNPEAGLATFRRPTLEETKKPEAFNAYLKATEANFMNAEIITLTRCIAAHKVALEEGSVGIKRRIQLVLDNLIKTRSHIIRYKKIPYPKIPDLEPVNFDPVPN